jgi:flagellin-like protein
MNNKAESAVIGIILMVAIVIAIAAAVYVYVEENRNKIDKPIFLSDDVEMRLIGYDTNDTEYEGLFNYSFENNSAIMVHFNITNNRETIIGQLEMRSYKISNTTEYDDEGNLLNNYSTYGIGIVKIPIWAGVKGELHSYLFENVVGNETYFIDIKFISEKGGIYFEPLYNVKRE